LASNAMDDVSVVRGVARANPLKLVAVVANGTPAKCATDPLLASARIVFVAESRKKTVPVVCWRAIEMGFTGVESQRALLT
jgi:hypothetical protein